MCSLVSVTRGHNDIPGSNNLIFINVLVPTTCFSALLLRHFIKCLGFFYVFTFYKIDVFFLKYSIDISSTGFEKMYNFYCLSHKLMFLTASLPFSQKFELF